MAYCCRDHRGKPYGPISSRQRQDHARRSSRATAILKALVKTVPYKIHTVLTDNGVQFVQHDKRTGRGFVDHIFGAVCVENGIEHRRTKPYHPWTNGQAERMVRTIKDATVRSFHYASIIDLRRHVRDWLLAYNYAKQLKALRFKTPFEAIRQLSDKKPETFNRTPTHDMLGPNTQSRGSLRIRARTDSMRTRT